MKPPKTGELTALVCGICGADKNPVQYAVSGDGSLRTTKRVVLACPKCDALNAWPNHRRP